MESIGIFFLRALSRLPFGFLYAISNLLFFLIYSVFGYRKKVVMENLRHSFPEKTEPELRQIMKKFYRNLCDIIVESLKMISMSREEVIKRNEYSEHTVVDALNANGKSCFYFAGHVGNWEWSPNVAGIASQVKLWGVYKPLSSKGMDELTKFYRSRFGCEMIAMDQIARRIITDKEIKNICFIADQTPANPESNIWVDFLNRKTLFFSASAKLAIKTKTPIVYGSLDRVKRGYYKYHFEILVEDPSKMNEQDIMQLFASRLEKDIRRQPENWLWSHRRWKHTKA